MIRAMHWFDPGPLIDRDLQLIAPDARWIDDVLAACHHPLTARDDPRQAGMTRQQLVDFLRAAPGGHDPGDPAAQRAPGYAFWMRLRPEYSPPVKFAGGCSLRISEARDVQLYFGNIGYHVYPPARGNHYSERAVRLLLPLARAHGLKQLWITVNPDNWASRRTCERLNCQLIDIVDLPETNSMYQRGERQKCRYLLPL